MLTLKNFLNESEEVLALKQVVSLLLERIASGSVKGDTAEHDAFCEEMSQFRERTLQETSPALLLITAGSAVQAMENYNLRITGLLKKQVAELQSVVSMVTETALKLGGENTRSAQRLQEIGNRFERAGSLEDLQELKSHLGDCLHSFRNEVQRLKAESDATILSLQQEIARRPVGAAGAPGAEIDPVTELPRQAAGLQAMQNATDGGKRLYVVAMVVKGVQSVNARFGFGVGDRMLRAFKVNIERQLLRADRLFRWDGPAIVVLMDRTESIGQVRAQVRRILEAHIDETFDVDGRSVLVPIIADWLVFPLTAPAALAVKQIQAFIAGQGAAFPSA